MQREWLLEWIVDRDGESERCSGGQNVSGSADLRADCSARDEGICVYHVPTPVRDLIFVRRAELIKRLNPTIVSAAKRTGWLTRADRSFGRSFVATTWRRYSTSAATLSFGEEDVNHFSAWTVSRSL